MSRAAATRAYRRRVTCIAAPGNLRTNGSRGTDRAPVFRFALVLPLERADKAAEARNRGLGALFFRRLQGYSRRVTSVAAYSAWVEMRSSLPSRIQHTRSEEVIMRMS